MSAAGSFFDSLNKIFQMQYNDMTNIISSMKTEQADVQQLLSQTKSMLDNLVPNHWQGDAASAFRQEMEDKVLPALTRLAKALEDSAATAEKVKGMVMQADEGTKGIFSKLEGQFKGFPGMN